MYWLCKYCKMIVALYLQGPLKLEGIFRRACEVTLRVMRKESEPLMRYVSVEINILVWLVPVFFKWLCPYFFLEDTTSCQWVYSLKVCQQKTLNVNKLTFFALIHMYRIISWNCSHHLNLSSQWKIQGCHFNANQWLIDDLFSYQIPWSLNNPVLRLLVIS